MRTKVLTLGLAVLFLIGCTTTAQQVAVSQSSTPRADPALRIVAVDLVSALAQLPGFDSWSMTTQVSPAKSNYGAALIEALRDVGYGVQRVSADQGQNYLAYRKKITTTESGETTLFDIEIRDVKVAREYSRDGQRWVPASPIRIQGAKPTRVLVYNELHGAEGKTTQFVSGVEFLDDTGQLIESRSALARVSGEAADFGERFREQRFLIMSRGTIFSRQRAAADVDKRAYRAVSEVMLTFPSTNPEFLGDLNKRAIVSMLKLLDPTSDRLLIRGCSHGKSLIWDGTEILSLERQQRVNQELLVAGVDANIIREEGCFSSNPNLSLPRQSVRLILQRVIQPS